jgi:hypothetical protein
MVEPSEKLDAAKVLKQQGNDHFRQGQLPEAFSAYGKCILTTQGLLCTDISDRDIEVETKQLH